MHKQIKPHFGSHHQKSLVKEDLNERWARVVQKEYEDRAHELNEARNKEFHRKNSAAQKK